MMLIPNGDDAIIQESKLIDYLLDLAHPAGGSKAVWFTSLGYSPHQADLLSRDLRQLLRFGSLVERKSSEFGIKYVVSGLLATPSGRIVPVTTVWIVETGQNRPRLITAFPAKE